MIDLAYLALGFVTGVWVGFKLWKQTYVKL